MVQALLEKFVGIRPGEKMYEVLLTREEFCHAVVLDYYYVVLSENIYIFNPEKYTKYYKYGSKVDINLVFSSDTNSKWLTWDEFIKIIEEMKLWFHIDYSL